MRQITDALSPANNLMTSTQQAQQAALESGGKSLLDGLKLFTEDLAKGRISMTDEGPSRLVRTSRPPRGSVVFQNEIFQLIQYTPTTEEVFERPFLIVPVYQQVLHSRPAGEELLRRSPGGVGAHRLLGVVAQRR